ncbi:hypothetical protein NN561_011769 [Cricetulus griseus]
MRSKCLSAPSPVARQGIALERRRKEQRVRQGVCCLSAPRQKVPAQRGQTTGSQGFQRRRPSPFSRSPRRERRRLRLWRGGSGCPFSAGTKRDGRGVRRLGFGARVGGSADTETAVEPPGRRPGLAGTGQPERRLQRGARGPAGLERWSEKPPTRPPGPGCQPRCSGEKAGGATGTIP